MKLDLAGLERTEISSDALHAYEEVEANIPLIKKEQAKADAFLGFAKGFEQLTKQSSRFEGWKVRIVATRSEAMYVKHLNSHLAYSGGLELGAAYDNYCLGQDTATLAFKSLDEPTGVITLFATKSWRTTRDGDKKRVYYLGFMLGNS